MKKFQQKYGIIPNVSDKDFFTNSIHVPVWKEVDPFTKIDIESQLTGYSSAGCITYVELDSSILNNIDALEQIVNYAMDKDIPYFALNIPNDLCLNCGYTGEINDVCPECGGTDIQRLRRVTGYLTGDYKTAFNKGKQQEVQSTPEEVGKATAEVLKAHVPEELAGVVFLSGGQTVEQATNNLAEVKKNGPFPWGVTFSFARALQDPALYAWNGDIKNADKAREAFKERLVENTKVL